MTKLWKNARFADDAFIGVDDATELPKGRDIIVTLKHWREARAALLAHGGAVGVIADPSAELTVDGDQLDRLAAIVIPFAKFADGRGYSLARRLRDEFHFKGELRATGDVLLDQIPLMLRCGFDAFEIASVPTLAALAAGHLPAIQEVYQTAVRGRSRTTAAF
jgi:uncharacterized protein (DUF934 family)